MLCFPQTRPLGDMKEPFGTNAGLYDPAFQAVAEGLSTRSRLKDVPMGTYMNFEMVSQILDQLQDIYRTVIALCANFHPNAMGCHFATRFSNSECNLRSSPRLTS